MATDSVAQVCLKLLTSTADQKRVLGQITDALQSAHIAWSVTDKCPNACLLCNRGRQVVWSMPQS